MGGKASSISAPTIDLTQANQSFERAMEDIKVNYGDAVNEFNLASNSGIRSLEQGQADFIQNTLPFSETATDAMNEMRQFMGMAPMSATLGLSGQLRSAAKNLEGGQFMFDNGLGEASSNLAGGDAFSVAYGDAQSKLTNLANELDSAETIQNPQVREQERQRLVGELNQVTADLGPKYVAYSGETPPANQDPNSLYVQVDESPEGQRISRKLEEVNNAARGISDSVLQTTAKFDSEFQSEPGKALTADQVQERLSAKPEYQFALEQGTKSMERSQAARGMLGSGNALVEGQQFGQGLAESAFASHMGRLGQLSGMASPITQQGLGGQQQFNQQQAGQLQSQGTQRAGLLGQQGNQLAGLGAGQGNMNASAQTAQAQMQMQAQMANQKSQSGGGLFGGLVKGIGSKLLGGLF